jgi:cbb3-type cytochrome oxidase subunit 3
MRNLIEPITSILPVVSMVAFFAIFCFVLYYVFSDRRRAHQDRMRSMPLEDDHHA